MLFKRKIEGFRQIMRFDNRWQLLMDRILFRKTNLNVYRLGDIECIVDYRGGDINGLRYCLTSGPYRSMINKLSLGSEISFLDFGANCGGFPLLLRSLGFSLTKFVCVEMNPNTFVRLQFNVGHNVKRAPKLLNAALCGTQKTLDLRLEDGSTGDSIAAGSAASEQKGSQYRLKGMLFDDVFDLVWNDSEGQVDLCKIDVEGAEYEVFSNSGHDRLSRCRYLIIEIHKPTHADDQQKVLAEITHLGFVEMRENRYEDVYLFKNQALTERE